MRSGQQKRKRLPMLLSILAIFPPCVDFLVADALPKPTSTQQATSADAKAPASHMQEPIDFIGTVVAMSRNPWENMGYSTHVLLVRIDDLITGEESARYVRVDFPERDIYTDTEEYRVRQKLEDSLREPKTWKMSVHPDPRGSMGCAWRIPPAPRPDDLMMRWVPVILPVGGALGYPDINTVPCYVLDQNDITEVASAIVTKSNLAERTQTASKDMARLVVRITTQNLPNILSKVESFLRPETDVPLRWPSFISAGADEDNPLYVNLLSADRSSYSIELGWTDGCTGGNACHYATVRGSVEPLSENEGVKVPVKLSRGIRGYFIDSSCGAHCDDSAIGWTEGKYHYSVSIKAEKKENLIKIVNSAIAAGHGLGSSRN